MTTFPRSITPPACQTPRPLRRRDPVVTRANQASLDGPLDEVALSHYERDGYLC